MQSIKDLLTNKEQKKSEVIVMNRIPVAEGRTYVVMTRWKSRADFEAWTKSEAFISAHRKQSPGLAEGRPTLEIYEVLAD